MTRATDTPSAITGQDACRLDRSRKANNQPGYLRFTVVAPTVIIESLDHFGYTSVVSISRFFVIRQ
jgi:hypothetical protein